MASIIPREVKLAVATGYSGETLKIALFNDATLTTGFVDDGSEDTYTEIAAAHAEVTSTGYTAGGYTLANKTTGYDGSQDAYLDNSVNPTWTGVTFTATHAVLYETATNKVRAIYDLGGSKAVTTGTFTLILDAAGLLTVTS
jgi:hypothetical protein